MFPISYLVYNVNYLTCLLITYLVYSENYHVYLLITRTNQSGEYKINHSRQGFIVHKQLLSALGLGWFMNHKPLSTVVYL